MRRLDCFETSRGGLRKHLSLAAFCLVACGAAAANAQQGVAYDGYLEITDNDGTTVAASESVAMRFSLYASSSGGTALWSEERSSFGSRSCGSESDCSVSLRNGRFSVILGEYVSIADSVIDADSVYLGIAVWDGAAWTQLAGRQQLAPVAGAMRARYATDLYLAGSLEADDLVCDGTFTADYLDVSSSATLANDLVCTDVVVTGTANFDGNLTIGSTMTVGGTVTTVDDGDLEIYTNSSMRGAIGRTGNLLEFGPGSEMPYGHWLEAATTISGTLSIGTTMTPDTINLNSGGTYRIPAARFFMWKYTNHGNNGSNLDTGISTSSWICWLGGWEFGNAEIDDNGSDNVWRAYVYDDGNTWAVSMDFASTGTNETAESLVVCARREAFAVTDGEWY